MKKVGEVVAVAEDGSYDVDYTDEVGVLQHEHVTADKISAVEAEGDGDEDEKGGEEE